MTLTEFKSELRLLDIKHDPWGTAMEAMFECCDHIWDRGEYVPPAWEYVPAAMVGNKADKDNYWYELYRNASRAQLLAIGWLLERYTQYLRFKDMDY